MVLGSFTYESEIIERPNDNSAVVSIMATNTTQLGSMLRINDDAYNYLNNLGPKIGIDPVVEQFVWTETIQW